MRKLALARPRVRSCPRRTRLRQGRGASSAGRSRRPARWPTVRSTSRPATNRHDRGARRQFPGEGSAGERLRSLIEQGRANWTRRSASRRTSSRGSATRRRSSSRAPRTGRCRADRDDRRGRRPRRAREGVRGQGAREELRGRRLPGGERRGRVAASSTASWETRPGSSRRSTPSDGGSALDGDERYDEATADIADDMGSFT